MRREKKRADAIATEQLEEEERKVKDVFLETPVDVVIALLDPATPFQRRVLAHASKFLAEWDLAKWVRQLNVSSGAPVPSSRLLDHYNMTAAHLPEAGRPPRHEDLSVSRTKMFLRRWRRRERVRLGIVRPTEILPNEVKLAKVFPSQKLPQRVSL